MPTKHQLETRKILEKLALVNSVKRPIRKSALKRAMIYAISFVVGPFKCRAPNIDTPLKGQKQSDDPINDDPT
jgi:hypothetical protein